MVSEPPASIGYCKICGSPLRERPEDGCTRLECLPGARGAESLKWLEGAPAAAAEVMTAAALATALRERMQNNRQPIDRAEQKAGWNDALDFVERSLNDIFNEFWRQEDSRHGARNPSQASTR
jgi:hypothetical protein